MANSACGEPYCCRNSVFQRSKTLRMQISATCESSPVVSSSDATFASSRTAMRVISRPFQRRRAEKPWSAIELPAANLLCASRLRGDAGLPALPRNREAHKRFAAGKATEDCLGRGSGALRKYWRQREDEAEQLHPAKIVRLHL